jgi:hypothetical protein
MKISLGTAALLVVSLLACCSTAADSEKQSGELATREWLRDFGAKYAYDTGYMVQLLDLSPAAYDVFASAMAMSEHRVHLSVEEHFVACISALLADDCGACSQLNLRMASEAGVDRAVLRQLLEEPDRLPTTLQLIHDYATQVVRGGNADPARVALLRQILGDEAFAELAINVIGVRIYPALRRAMGAEVACPPPNLNF